jgi:hypothetical protein
MLSVYYVNEKILFSLPAVVITAAVDVCRDYQATASANN